MVEPEECPFCHVSFKGDPIPEYHLKYFGNATHFLQGVIGIYSRESDRTVAWHCLACNKEWPRKD
jgi:hypothetical protein